MQESTVKIAEWSFEWGFKLSVDKRKTMFFTRKRVGSNLKLKLDHQELRRVKQFKFLGLWFDERLTWAVHIQKIFVKCKNILNVMRCLAGSEGGADITALKTSYTGLMRSVLDDGYIT